MTHKPETPPVDWTGPLVAVHRDTGEVRGVALRRGSDEDYDYWLSDVLPGPWAVFRQNGSHANDACPWRIRNARPGEPGAVKEVKAADPYAHKDGSREYRPVAGATDLSDDPPFVYGKTPDNVGDVVHDFADDSQEEAFASSQEAELLAGIADPIERMIEDIAPACVNAFREAETRRSAMRRLIARIREDYAIVPKMTEEEALGWWSIPSNDEYFLGVIKELGILRPKPTLAERFTAETGHKVSPEVLAALEWMEGK